MNFYLYSKKTLTVFVLTLFLFSFSCKGGKKEFTNVESVNQEISNKPFFKLSLAQWSLHREIETGKLDPFDFPKVAKELGFDAVEWVDQLYAKEIDSMGFDAVIERWKQESEKHGVKNVLIMVDRAGDLSHFDVEKRNEAVEKHKKYVERFLH